MTENKRTKTVSFRLTSKEYEEIKSFYLAHGARSVSELARIALQKTIESELRSNAPVNGANGDVTKLNERVVSLDREVARLARLLEAELFSRSHR